MRMGRGIRQAGEYKIRPFITISGREIPGGTTLVQSGRSMGLVTPAPK
jgi:hypothetical protein